MQLTTLRRPLQAAASNCCRTATTPAVSSLSERFAALRLDVGHTSTGIGGQRWASVKSQGAYKLTSKKTIPKKLGAKRTGDQYVIPGNILYKQRGTIWHAGENCILGRDHTIHAAVAGYVKYYRDPLRHPTRQYIGVVFNKEDKLPYPPNQPRVRRLGLVAVKRKTEETAAPKLSASGIPMKVVRKGVTEPVAPAPVVAITTPETAAVEAAATAKTEGRSKRLSARQRKAEAAQLRLAQRKMIKETRVLHLQDDYSYREHNWEIGRLVGMPGRVQGAGNTQSRRAALRARQRKKDIEFGTRKAEARRKKQAHLEHIEARKIMKAEREKALAAQAAKQKAKKEKADKAAAEKTAA